MDTDRLWDLKQTLLEPETQTLLALLTKKNIVITTLSFVRV